MRSVVAAACAMLAIPTAVFAAPVQITGYDIQSATESGFGGWSHSYAGAISPVRPFTNGPPGSPTGTISNYANGTGTLADGVIGTSTFDTQLFVQGDPDGLGQISPVITLKLANPVQVNSILLSGGNIGLNFFPGQLTGVTVEIGGQSVALTTTDTGAMGDAGILYDDLVVLTGTPLASITTDTIVLRDFVFPSYTSNQFCLTEISVDGTSAPPPMKSVKIDIKPRSPFNVVFLNSPARVKVGVISTKSFDARTVVPSSLKFGATGNEASWVSCGSPRDLNRDGRLDLICSFSIGKTGWKSNSRKGILTGKTTSNVSITGSDYVWVVGGFAGRDVDEDGDQ